jgi:hypothetical protein
LPATDDTPLATGGALMGTRTCEEPHKEQLPWSVEWHTSSVVLPMTESQQEPERVATRLRLSHAEAEELRSLLRCTDVPRTDELALLRTGKLIAATIYRSPVRGW